MKCAWVTVWLAEQPFTFTVTTIFKLSLACINRKEKQIVMSNNMKVDIT